MKKIIHRVVTTKIAEPALIAAGHPVRPGKAMAFAGIKKLSKLLIILVLAFSFCQQAFAFATVHHLYLISRRLVEVIGSPFYGIFVQGPENIKTAYHAETREQEKPYKNGTFKFKVAGILRAPGEETKGIVDGITNSVSSAGKAAKEFISIFFGD